MGLKIADLNNLGYNLLFSFLSPFFAQKRGSILSDVPVAQNLDYIVCMGIYVWLYEAEREAGLKSC